MSEKFVLVPFSNRGAGEGGMTGMVTMEDTMLMLRLSMMTAKIVSHSLTVARTMSIEIQVLFTVE